MVHGAAHGKEEIGLEFAKGRIEPFAVDVADERFHVQRNQSGFEDEHE